MLTIFTPTYNRANTLPRLYESLRRQSDMNFEWIVINDGSTDNTDILLRSFIAEGFLKIVYQSTTNGGKMRAINRAARLASGEFFLTVDSDDYVTDNCVEKVLAAAERLPNELGGIVFRKHNNEAGANNKHFSRNTFDADPVRTFIEDGIGDRAEVIRTKLLHHNSFPEIEGEKFVPEAYIWNKIGTAHKFRYINEPICIVQYLDDGYTRRFMSCLKNNPVGFSLHYSQMLKYPVPFTHKIKYAIRLCQCLYYRFRLRKRVTQVWP